MRTLLVGKVPVGTSKELYVTITNQAPGFCQQVVLDVTSLHSFVLTVIPQGVHLADDQPWHRRLGADSDDAVVATAMLARLVHRPTLLTVERES